jgi:hypothetical protein
MRKLFAYPVSFLTVRWRQKSNFKRGKGKQQQLAWLRGQKRVNITGERDKRFISLLTPNMNAME